MTGAIDETMHLLEYFTVQSMHIVDLRDVSKQPVCAGASFPLARGVHLLLTLVTPEASWSRAVLKVALVNLRIRVTELDGNVALQLVLEADSLDTRNSLHNSGLSVSDVADGSNIDRSLAGNNLWGQRGEGLDVQVFWLGLRW